MSSPFKRSYSRPFVGVRSGQREVFRFRGYPRTDTHPQYGAIVGPFRTMRGARYMAGSPQCADVGTAERAAEHEYYRSMSTERYRQ